MNHSEIACKFNFHCDDIFSPDSALMVIYSIKDRGLVESQSALLH